MNWLITGGCGFIGSALTKRLLAQGETVRIFDNLSVGSVEFLELITGHTALVGSAIDTWSTNGPHVVVGDIGDPEALATAVAGAHVIVHLAANTGVAPSVEDPMSDCLANVVGTLNVLEAARHQSVPRVVFASSGAPLGVQEPPLNEDMAPHPASPYGASKLAGEGYCSAYFHCFGVETVALRFGNVYGPGSTHKASVVAKFIKAGLEGQTLEIYGDGSQTRDFIFLGDLLDAVHAAGTRKGIGGEVFQIATNHETTVSEMCELLLGAFDALGVVRPPVEYGPIRQGDVQRNYSDTTKASQVLGWQSVTELPEGLIVTLRSFVAKGDEAQ